MEISVAYDGIFFICPHCLEHTQGEVEEGVNVNFIYCSRCHKLVCNMNRKTKKLYLWHIYNQGEVLPEEESPYP